MVYFNLNTCFFIPWKHSSHTIKAWSKTAYEPVNVQSSCQESMVNIQPKYIFCIPWNYGSHNKIMVKNIKQF